MIHQTICAGLIFLLLAVLLIWSCIAKCSPKWCIFNLVAPLQDRIPVAVAISMNVLFSATLFLLSSGLWAISKFICARIHE